MEQESSEETMKISVSFKNQILEIRKEGDGLQAEIWQKKLEDFELRKNVSTGLTVSNKKIRKILFWQPIGENILMAYTRGGEVKACYAPTRGAYLPGTAHFPGPDRIVPAAAGGRGQSRRVHL